MLLTKFVQLLEEEIHAYSLAITEKLLCPKKDLKKKTESCNLCKHGGFYFVMKGPFELHYCKLCFSVVVVAFVNWISNGVSVAKKA